MKIVTVVGARPQFIKAAAVSRALLARRDAGLSEVLVHTGQHYDKMMSDVFFDELGIRAPAYNLAIAGGGHGAMTGRMLEALERVFVDERPDWVLIYGDTNSTLAAALAASKLHIPIAHVEAGLRSFNMRMPEEVNRIVADRLSTLLLCPTETAVGNLQREGVTDGVHLVGDVMYDVALHFAKAADEHQELLSRLGVQAKAYALATCHRAETTDDPEQLGGVVAGLAEIARHQPVVLPIHPRTRGKLAEFGLTDRLGTVQLIEPVSYLDMVTLEKNAAVIVTDSGGIQKEAFFYRVPCVTTRRETEWVETVDAGWNVLVGTDSRAMVSAVESLAQRQRVEVQPYGDGDAANRILDLLQAHPAAKRSQ
jgi:UDP-GlcNAc3NAcA epimerase